MQILVEINLKIYEKDKVLNSFKKAKYAEQDEIQDKKFKIVCCCFKA